jgi:hypothetical protein
VPVVDLALVIDHSEKLIVIQCLGAGIASACELRLVVVAKETYVPLPSTAAVVYCAKLIDDGTRTGVSILYVSFPRCSKRCSLCVTI